MSRPRTTPWLATVFAVVVVAAVVTALILLGSPRVQRQRRMDERRIEDLTTIENYVHSYWTRHKALAADLAALDAEPGFQVPRQDPETGQAYVYEPTGATSFRLCARFARDTAQDPPLPRFMSRWAHGAGEHCFDLRIPRHVQRGD